MTNEKLIKYSQMKKEPKNTNENQFLFGQKNYFLMIVGILFIAVGFILMAGGGSDNRQIFNEEIYNFQRIRLAPTLVLIGFAIEIFAIFAGPKSNK